MNQINALSFPKEIVLLSEQRKYDRDMGIFYTETKWEYQGHKIDINIDEYGYHFRIDKGNCMANLNEQQLLKIIVWFLGKTR